VDVEARDVGCSCGAMGMYARICRRKMLVKVKGERKSRKMKGMKGKEERVIFGGVRGWMKEIFNKFVRTRALNDRADLFVLCRL